MHPTLGHLRSDPGCLGVPFGPTSGGTRDGFGRPGLSSRTPPSEPTAITTDEVDPVEGEVQERPSDVLECGDGVVQRADDVGDQPSVHPGRNDHLDERAPEA